MYLDIRSSLVFCLGSSGVALAFRSDFGPPKDLRPRQSGPAGQNATAGHSIGNSTTTRNSTTTPTSTSTSIACTATAAGRDTYYCQTCNGNTTNGQNPYSDWDWALADEALDDGLIWWSKSCCGKSPDASNDHDIMQGWRQLWDGPPDADCTLGGSSCDAVSCSQVKYPGAYMLINSFINFRDVIKAQYSAMEQAQAPVTADIGTFASTFAPVKLDNTDAILKALLDTAVVGMALVTAGSVGLAAGGIETAIKSGVSNLANTAKLDGSKLPGSGLAHLIEEQAGKEAEEPAKNEVPLKTANALVAASSSFAHDSLSALQQKSQNQNNLSSIASDYAQSMLTNIDQFWSSFLYANDSNAIDVINTTLRSGMWAGNPNTDNLDPDTLTGLMKTALYGQLLPPAWGMVPLGNHGTYPAIVVQEGTNNQTNPFGEIPNYDKLARRMVVPPATVDNHWALSNSEMNKARLNLPNEPNTYYLIGTGYGDPMNRLTSLLPGYEQLTDGNQWGGITLHDIWNSSYAGYQLNGNKNGYVIPDVTNLTASQNTNGMIFQNGPQTPGFFSIPICSGSEIGSTVMSPHGVDPTQSNCTFPCCG